MEKIVKIYYTVTYSKAIEIDTEIDFDRLDEESIRFHQFLSEQEEIITNLPIPDWDSDLEIDAVYLPDSLEVYLIESL